MVQDVFESAFLHSAPRHVQPVFQLLDPEEMERGFVAWVSSIARLTAGEVVAIPSHGRRPVRGDPGHAAQNFSLLNRLVLNLLKQEKSSKRSFKGKRLKAAWDPDCLFKVLGF